MTSLLAIFLLAGVLAVVPARVDAWAFKRGASPRTLAILALMTIFGIATVPVTFAICTGSSAASGSSSEAVKVLSVVGALLVALTAGRTVARMIQIRRTWSSLERAASALCLPEGFGGVAVLPVAEPLAFAMGRKVFISRGLVQTLSAKQLEAVVAHEREHADRGHGRLLGLAQALSHGLFGMPPARRAASVLNRELEALADQGAAARLGDRRAVESALRAVAETAAREEAVDPSAKARLERFGAAARPNRPADGAVRIFVALLLGAVLASICLAIHAGSWWLGLAVCVLAVAGFASFATPLLGDRRPSETFRV